MNGSMTLVSVLAVCVGAVTRSRAGAFYQILNQQAGLLYRMTTNTSPKEFWMTYNVTILTAP